MALMADLFGHSPIRPMQKHMGAAVACAREVGELFDAMESGDLDKVREMRARIDALEHKADEIKNEIRSHLPKRLFMAFERRDLLEILDYQDSIADVAQDIAGLADQRGMVIPKGLKEPLVALLKRSIAACEQGERIVNELDELVETGFGGREATRVETMIDELSRIESDTDELAEKVTRQLFAMESELGVGTYFWYQVIGWIADLADYAERVGNRLRLLIAT